MLRKVIKIDEKYRVCLSEMWSISYQTKYTSMRTIRPAKPCDLLGYFLGATIISKTVDTIIRVCMRWFSHQGKYGSRAFGSTSSRSTNMRAQNVTPTNYKHTLLWIQQNTQIKSFRCFTLFPSLQIVSIYSFVTVCYRTIFILSPNWKICQQLKNSHKRKTRISN